MGTNKDRSLLRFVGAAAVVSVALVVPAGAQVTARVSVSSRGAQGNSGSTGAYISISADGRYVAFNSSANNLVPGGDANGPNSDVFVRDRQLGMTEVVSVSSSGAQGIGGSFAPSMSADGRYVAFDSQVTNLVVGDTNGFYDVFVRDRQLGITEIVSVSSSGAQGNHDSEFATISADGRYVAFSSSASNLVAGGTNSNHHVYVRDRRLGTTEIVSVSSSGAQGNHDSEFASISADGRYVAFASSATNLVQGDTNGTSDVFVRDRQLGTTERVSVSSSGVEGNGFSGYQRTSISADGRYVAFDSFASDLVAGDTNGSYDVFVRDRQLGITEIASVSSSGAQGNNSSGYEGASISANGRYVEFWSNASNLVVGDTNGFYDVFVRDRQLGTTEIVSVSSSGAQGNQNSEWASISADGRYVAFSSLATDLVPGDTNGCADIFVRDRIGGPSFTSLCDPGIGGVVACPCANSPSGLGLGCDNSSHTGGATLSASGGTYLSSDSLVFTTSGEKPTATSIVLQGNALSANGVVFGQGVRCIGGTLKRLYTKAASGGSITAPNFLASDPQVSSRSVALGDVIQPGQSRWYLVYYFDSTVLGGCPASSTFNATQTGQVDWSP
jgi:hypothetical protein